MSIFIVVIAFYLPQNLLKIRVRLNARNHRLVVGIRLLQQHGFAGDQFPDAVQLAFAYLLDENAEVMPLDLYGARAEEDDEPFMLSFVGPLISQVVGPGEALRPSPVPALDMEIERLCGVLALGGEAFGFSLRAFLID
ncbi:MAG TPA: hypothetical protein VHW09_27340 [Bryobacteraceae bacterium]|nr:hypothetical protein [Bryobacteraceae bacterium]